MNIIRNLIKGQFLRSIITVIIVLVAGCVYSAEPKILYKADFESGKTDGWSSADKDSVLSASNNTTSQDSKYSIQVSGNEKSIGMAKYGLNIKSTPNTYLEFDWRSDSQDPLKYIAFALILKDFKKPLWLWCDKGNAVENPVRGVWHHAKIQLSEFKDLNQMRTMEDGDIITGFFIHQIQLSGIAHSIAIDNIKIIDGEASGFTSTSSWTNGKSSMSKDNSPEMPVTKNSFPLICIAACAEKPVIDGKIDDPCWRQAASLCLVPNFSGGNLTENTRFMITYDSQNIYIAAEVQQSFLDPVLNLLSKVKCTVKERDGGVYMDDSIEIFLLPENDNYYQIAVNMDGTIFDAKGKEQQWNSHAIVATQKGEKTWTVEVAVPLSDFNLKNIDGVKFRANFYRNNPAKNESGAWSPTGKSFHTVEAFGSALFTGSSAPVIMQKSFTLKSGSASTLIAASASEKLRILGGEKEITIQPSDKNDLTINEKPDKDGIGQISVVSENGQKIFRTPAVPLNAGIVKTEYEITSPGNKIDLYVNGEKAFSGDNEIKGFCNLGNKKNTVALKISGPPAQVTGSVSFNGITSGLNEWIASNKEFANWNSTEINDSAWQDFNGVKKHGDLYLRCTIVKGASAFAPQLDKDTLFVTEGSTWGNKIRIANPQDFPLRNYKIHLELPKGLQIPIYEPGQKGWTRYANKMSIIEKSDTSEYIFSFDKPVPKLAYNFGYNNIHFMLDAKTKANSELKGRCYISASGFKEVPYEFKIKTLPELKGVQPQNIAISLWTSGRIESYSNDEMKLILPAFKSMGVNSTGTNLIQFQNIGQTPEKGIAELKILNESIKKQNIVSIYTFYGNIDTYFLKDIVNKDPESKLVNNMYKHRAWQGLMCPIAFMKSEDVKARIESLSAFHDRILYDIESGIGSSCLCANCREQFAKENNLASIPTEEAILKKLKKEWVKHQIKVNYDVYNYAINIARKVNLAIKTDIYSAYQLDNADDKYGMDWGLYKNIVALPYAGYSESARVILDTRNVLGKRPMVTGLILNTNLFEYKYDNQNIKARLFSQLINGGFGGIILWSWEELNGAGMAAVADFSRGAAAYESFLKEKLEIPADNLIKGLDKEYGRVYKDGDNYLYVLINNTMNQKNVSIAVPVGIDTPVVYDFYRDKVYENVKDASFLIPPNDVLIINVKNKSK